MRTAVVVVFGLAAAGLLAGPAAVGQQKAPGPEEIPVRYGQTFNPKAFPQGTAKEVMASVVTAAEKGDYAYLAAHLLDPAFVDARIEAMCAGPKNPFVEAAVADVNRIADIQQKNPDAVPAARRVPADPAKLAARVETDARTAAFAQLTRLIRGKFTDDPETLKDLRRFTRGGAFPDPGAPGDSAKVELPDVKDRAVFLKRAGGRWYVENKLADDKAPPPPAPEPKKE